MTSLRLAAVIGLVVSAFLVAGAARWVRSLGPVPLGMDIEYSARVLDHAGHLLRAYTAGDGRWRLPASVADIDPRFFDVLFAYEDGRFPSHHGVDPLAMARAVFQLVTNGRALSGGSTLTMQVARLLEPRNGRTVSAKLHQIVRALEIERALNKYQILSLYLGLAPYGGNIEGVRAASLVYFGKEPRHLSLGEVALLVALPQAPEQRRPDRFPELARAARNRVLDRFAATDRVPADEIALAKAESMPTGRRPMPMLAPHASDRAIANAPATHELRLSIDSGLQQSLEELAREREHTLVASLSSVISVAILAADNATGQVIAHVGSPAYFDASRAGQVDMTQAMRSPGSTLKPFIYGLGFEDGFIHPETLIEDRPMSYGAYAPKNFDYNFQGTLTVREALQLSRNVPAIAVLERVGASRLAARLTQAGALLTLSDDEAPGLAIGLGGVGIRLSDLVMLYAGIARLGMTLPLSERVDAPAPQPRRLMGRAAAWYVGNVLVGSPPPDNGAPGRIAFKTGTSYGYRDAWSIGFNGRYTVGVWVGRPDGAPVPGLFGRAAAAPILFDVFARLGAPAALPRPPNDALVTSSAKLPPPLRHFQPGRLAGDTGRPPLHIMFPPDGARLELSITDGKSDPVALKIVNGVPPLTLLVNGVPELVEGRGNLFFQPSGPGFSRVTVMDASGAADSIVVRLDATVRPQTEAK
jgi:penicillin-binding protein 1C